MNLHISQLPTMQNESVIIWGAMGPDEDADIIVSLEKNELLVEFIAWEPAYEEWIGLRTIRGEEASKWIRKNIKSHLYIPYGGPEEVMVMVNAHAGAIQPASYKQLTGRLPIEG